MTVGEMDKEGVTKQADTQTMLIVYYESFLEAIRVVYFEVNCSYQLSFFLRCSSFLHCICVTEEYWSNICFGLQVDFLMSQALIVLSCVPTGQNRLFSSTTDYNLFLRLWMGK